MGDILYIPIVVGYRAQVMKDGQLVGGKYFLNFKGNNANVQLNPQNQFQVDIEITGEDFTTIQKFEASEDLQAYTFVNLFDDNGTIKIRKASNASYDTRAYGFIKTTYASGEIADVFLSVGTVLEDAFTNLSIGTSYFLDNSGGITSTPPDTGISQELGVALASNKLLIYIKPPIVLNS